MSSHSKKWKIYPYVVLWPVSYFLKLVLTVNTTFILGHFVTNLPRDFWNDPYTKLDTHKIRVSDLWEWFVMLPKSCHHPPPILSPRSYLLSASHALSLPPASSSWSTMLLPYLEGVPRYWSQRTPARQLLLQADAAVYKLIGNGNRGLLHCAT